MTLFEVAVLVFLAAILGMLCTISAVLIRICLVGLYVISEMEKLPREDSYKVWRAEVQEKDPFGVGQLHADGKELKEFFTMGGFGLLGGGLLFGLSAIVWGLFGS